MKHYSYIPVRSLQLFADGGQGSGGAAQGTGVTAPAAGVQQGVKGNPASDAGNGVQVQGGAPAAGVQQATEQPDRNAEFERLIKGQYKDLYDARVSETVQKRVKGSIQCHQSGAAPAGSEVRRGCCGYRGSGESH